MKREPFIHLILILLSGTLLLTEMSCLEEPIHLDKKARNLVDTLVLQETKMLRVELDSLCDATFDTRVAAAVDSILLIRTREIDELIKRKQYVPE